MEVISNNWISDISPRVCLGYLAQFLVYFNTHVWNFFMVVASLYMSLLLVVNFKLKHCNTIKDRVKWSLLPKPCDVRLLDAAIKGEKGYHNCCHEIILSFY